MTRIGWSSSGASRSGLRRPLKFDLVGAHCQHWHQYGVMRARTKLLGVCCLLSNLFGIATAMLWSSVANLLCTWQNKNSPGRGFCSPPLRGRTVDRSDVAEHVPALEGTMEEGFDEREVKRYYIDVERYDWVTDPKYPEKLFHLWREREIMWRIKKHCQGAMVLDVGCGTGLISRHLGESHVVACDINPWAITKAKMHTSNGTECVLGDAEDLPLASAVFDTVICTDVLEHLANPQRALQEMLRVMKPGALLIGEVPSKSLVWRYRTFLTSTCPLSEPFHHNYSISEVKSMLSKFRVVELNRGVFGLEIAFVAGKRIPVG